MAATRIELLLIVLAACSGGLGKSAANTPSEGVALPDVPFDELDPDLRAEFMKQKVMPAMQPIYQRHDPERFADFNCKTCHGEAHTEDNTFAMPNEGLVVLPRREPDLLKKFKYEDVEWMRTEVKPEMARILKLSDAAMSGPKAFGCFSCHMSK